MMGGWQIFVATMVMAGAMGGVLLSLRPDRMPDGHSVEEVRARIVSEAATPTTRPAAGHAVPDRALEASEAHRIMREHLECAAADCPCKAAALWTLVAVGRLAPRRAGRRPTT